MINTLLSQPRGKLMPALNHALNILDAIDLKGSTNTHTYTHTGRARKIYNKEMTKTETDEDKKTEDRRHET